MDTNTFDYGISFGLGSDFIIQGYQLTIEAKYSLGFVKLFQQDIKNRIFSIIVGFDF